MHPTPEVTLGKSVVIDTGFQHPLLKLGDLCTQEGATYPAGPEEADHVHLLCHDGYLIVDRPIRKVEQH